MAEYNLKKSSFHFNISNRKTKKYIFMFCAIIPAFVIYTLFLLYPLLEGMAISFFDWGGLSAHKDFVGLKHYVELIEDLRSNSGAVLPAIMHDITLTIGRMIPTIIISFIFAEVLTRMKIKEGGFYKVIFFFPNVLSLTVIAMLWTFIYNPQFGLLNAFLKSIGLNSLAKPWLAGFNTVLPALTFPMIWASVGFFMVIFIAAIKGIPISIYESAMIDGATYIKQFFKITIPLLWEYIRIAIILMLVQSFGTNFVYVQVMTGGGPADASKVLLTELYQRAFQYRNFGYGAVIGVIATVIAIIYTIIVNKLLSKEVVEY